MAELRFDAPLAQFDGDEWSDFNDFQAADIENCNKDLDEFSDFGETGMNDTFTDTFSGSLEDLVNTFDSKIKECFCNYEENAEDIAPVQIRSQDEIMADCQMWWTITGNYGNMMPIDWSKTYAHELQTKSLHLMEKPSEAEAPALDLESDEELRQSFDMHSIIISSLHQDPMFTADEVITEIEGMMEDSTSAEGSSTQSDGLSCSSELLTFKERMPCLSNTNFSDSLKELSLSALNELYEELECNIKHYSETLIQELALRDELEYEKELKNQFISFLMSIQKKRRENSNERRKNNNQFLRKVRQAATEVRQAATGQHEPGTYLTTVIPYHRGAPPDTERLQVYVKILSAINDDSPAVPSLLTDYILKVLCPTT